MVLLWASRYSASGAANPYSSHCDVMTTWRPLIGLIAYCDPGQLTRPTQPFILLGSINAEIRWLLSLLVAPSGERLRGKKAGWCVCTVIHTWALQMKVSYHGALYKCLSLPLRVTFRWCSIKRQCSFRLLSSVLYVRLLRHWGPQDSDGIWSRRISSHVNRVAHFYFQI